jgi:hypothetical protein
MIFLLVHIHYSKAKAEGAYLDAPSAFVILSQ